jgi:hypothetical protein
MEKNKLKIVGAVPNAAVETQVKEKVRVVAQLLSRDFNLSVACSSSRN